MYIGDGVACEVELTPLTWFHIDLHNFRKLAGDDSLELANLYNKIFQLGQYRSALSEDAMDQEVLYPSFAPMCRDRAHRVNKLRQRAKEKLRSYLEAYHSKRENVKSVIKFRAEIKRMSGGDTNTTTASGSK